MRYLEFGVNRSKGRTGIKLHDNEDTTLSEVMKHSLESADISSIETDSFFNKFWWAARISFRDV